MVLSAILNNDMFKYASVALNFLQLFLQAIHKVSEYSIFVQHPYVIKPKNYLDKHSFNDEVLAILRPYF